MSEAHHARSVATHLIESIDYFDEVKWPDERVGKNLLGARLAAEAERVGIDPLHIPDQLAARWIRLIAAEETESASLIALEKAFRVAAQGDFGRSGRIFRAFMLDGARHLADAPRANADREREIRSKVGGAKGGLKAKPMLRKLPVNVHDELARLVAAGRSPRDAKSVLVQKYGATPQALNKALKKAASG